jgi:hypothetical protein
VGTSYAWHERDGYPALSPDFGEGWAEHGEAVEKFKTPDSSASRALGSPASAACLGGKAGALRSG